MGNPLSDGVRTYTWKHGRQMATVTKDGVTWTNIYNADGLRIKRASSTTTYTYVYNGSQLTQMTVGDNTLQFTYDAVGSPMLVTYNGTNYYYVTNLQGDVVAIVDANGNPVVRYEYDPWGALLSCAGSMANTLGVHNPLLYRAYVYDPETDLYYLQSRYYDPSLRRFINGDAYASTGQGIIGNNMFSYCLNNPVNCADNTGTRCVAVSALRWSWEEESRSFATPEEKLLDDFSCFIDEGGYTDADVAVHTHCAYLGKYTKNKDNTAGGVLAIVGFSALVISALPVVGECAVAFTITSVVGGTATVGSLVDWIRSNNERLTPGEYYMYQATIWWEEPEIYFGEVTMVKNVYVMTYVWDDSYKSNAKWVLIHCDYSMTRTYS